MLVFFSLTLFGKVRREMKKIFHFLFDKKHLIRTFWGGVLALLIFFLGIWYNSNSGPPKVEIINLKTYKDTLYIKLDEEFRTGLSQITRDVDHLRRLYVELVEEPIDQNDRNNNKEIRRISPPTPVHLSQTYNEAFSPRVESIPVLSEIYHPKFKVPTIVKGYAQKRLSGLAKVNLDKQSMPYKSELNLTFELLDVSIHEKITPLILTILRRESENSYTQIIDQHYKIGKSKNLIRLATDFGKGEYILRIGFYFLNDIITEYPEFYHTNFKINIS